MPEPEPNHRTTPTLVLDPQDIIRPDGKKKSYDRSPVVMPDVVPDYSLDLIAMMAQDLRLVIDEIDDDQLLSTIIESRIYTIQCLRFSHFSDQQTKKALYLDELSGGDPQRAYAPITYRQTADLDAIDATIPPQGHVIMRQLAIARLKVALGPQFDHVIDRLTSSPNTWTQPNPDETRAVGAFALRAHHQK